MDSHDRAVKVPGGVSRCQLSSCGRFYHKVRTVLGLKLRLRRGLGPGGYRHRLELGLGARLVLWLGLLLAFIYLGLCLIVLG